MYDVRLTIAAQEQADALPLVIKSRLQIVIARLRRWPEVSGAKPLKRELKGSYRIRTGAWRVLFSVEIELQRITIFRVDNRRDVYE